MPGHDLDQDDDRHGHPEDAQRRASDRAPTIARRRGARSDRPAESQIRSAAERTSDPPIISSSGASPVHAASRNEEAVDVALRIEETTRLRAFSRVAMVMILLVFVQLPFLGGDLDRRSLAGFGLVVMFALAVWGYAQTTGVETVGPIVYRVQGYGTVTCILVVELYVGFFSPMTVVLSMGIYHLAQSTDRLHATLIPLYVVVTWFAGAVLTTLGILPDTGLYRVGGVSTAAQIVMITGVTSTLLGAIWLAHSARNSVREAALESSRALLVAQRRDALLQEAQHQLDHAMRVAVGKPGRHTGALAGEYRLGELIGLGAMGEVYAATHELDGRMAAVKLLHAATLQREDHVARFLREAELSTRFEHPNIVKVYDVGRMPDGAPFMAMERLMGETLSDLLRERGQLSIREVIELGEAAGAGLAHAHEKGIVHRDFKPHNVLAAHEPLSVSEPPSARPSSHPSVHPGSPTNTPPNTHGRRWTVLDFGISKPFDSTGTLTGLDGVVGTPSYMSPEQARGLTLDARSDLFSLASVLYRALTGHPAFLGKDAPGIMFDVAYRMPERPSRQNESLSTEVDLVFAIALAKERTLRFGTARELMSALRKASRGALPEALRMRGQAVLAKTPWGARITEPNNNS